MKVNMKSEYKAGDLSKLLASGSPKGATPSKSTPEKTVFSEKKNKKVKKPDLNRSLAKAATPTPNKKLASPTGRTKLENGGSIKKAGTIGSSQKGSQQGKSKVSIGDSVYKKVEQARQNIADNSPASGKKKKQENVKKNAEDKVDKSEGRKEKQKKKKKKNRKSFGLFRRLERKKEEKKKNAKENKPVGNKKETTPESTDSAVTPKMKQDIGKDTAELSVSKNRKRKNKSPASVPEPNKKKAKFQEKLESDSDSSDDESDSDENSSNDDDSDVNKKDFVETKVVKSSDIASDESSDSDGENLENDNHDVDDNDDDDDDSDVESEDDSDVESEDDLSYKHDSSMLDKEKGLDSDESDDTDDDDDDDDEEEGDDDDDSDSSEVSENDEIPKGSTSAGFCPPEGIVHESLKKKGEKRKQDSDNPDEDTVPTKKQKSDDSGAEKGTRPRKDRLAKATNDRTIFVGNLSNSTKKKQLERLFKKFGEIESSRFRNVPVNDPKLPKRAIAITRDFHPQRNNFNGYVCFKNAESAKKALSMNGTEVDGLHIRVDMVGREKQKEPKKSVFVGNLPLDIEEEAVRKHFDDCGEIDNVRIVRDKKTCLGKGFGFVTFKESDGVSFALKLAESKLKGRKLRVESCIDGKKSSKQKSDKTSKTKQQTNKSNLEEGGSPKPKSDKPKKKKKNKNKITPSNVSKNPFQEEKKQSEKMKQKAKREKAEKKQQGTNALKKDIEKIMNEGRAEIEKNKEDTKQTTFVDKSFNKQKSGDSGISNGDGQNPKQMTVNKQKLGDFGKNKDSSGQNPKHIKFGGDDSGGKKSPKKTFEKKGGFQKGGFNKLKKFDNSPDFNKSQSSPNKSFGPKGSQFGKDGKGGFKKKPFSAGQNKSFEKKAGNFGKKPGFNKKSYNSPITSSSGGQGKHLKFD